MTLLAEILAITAEWPDWQSDALRRLFINGVLEAEDLSEIRSMIEGADEAPTPIRLTASHIPSLGDGQTAVLVGLQNLQHVNRFASGRRIEFSPTGLNVIFGENGAGKSGYSRVLKRACRARHSARVLPDAFEASPGTPSADIIIQDEVGHTTCHAWQEGGYSSAQLAMVSVYDSQCGQDYITEDGPCDFQPYGLPYLGQLAQAQSKIQELIGRERDAITLDTSPFLPLNGDHLVGRHISKLSVNTDLGALRSLASVSEEQSERIREIEKIQAALDVETPAKLAEALAKRLDAAAEKCRTIELVTSDRAIDRLQELDAAFQTAVEADKAAQSLLRGSDETMLQGTGGPAWKLLFQAAQSFSAQAYPEADAHPVTDQDARCVLCQQELSPSSQIRLQRFREYVAGQAALSLASASVSISNALTKVHQASTDVLDQATAIELQESDPATFGLIEAARDAWAARQQWASDASALGNYNCPRPAPPAQPLLSVVLTNKAQSLREKAAELRSSKDEEQIRELEKEHAELLSRQMLSGLLPQVEVYVENAKHKKHLSDIHNKLRTQALSTLITRLSQQHITEALAKAMRDELRELGSRSPQPVLVSQTRRGQNMMTLSLDRAILPPGDILSEGEQRAMGMALFLAETRMRGDKSTVVFDDPSTSLDHRFRKNIAKRVVALAQERQVIIFTHDAVFLSQLQMASSDADVGAHFQTIQWDGGKPGSVMNGLAWENKKFGAQFQEILDEATALSRSANDYLNDEERRRVRDLHARLRGALERGVRDVILNDVVHPFVDEIKIAKLGAIAGFTIEEWQQVIDLHDQCSGVIAAHDTNPDRQQEIPHPTELLNELQRIKGVFDGCAKRVKDFTANFYNPHMDKRSLPRKA